MKSLQERLVLNPNHRAPLQVISAQLQVGARLPPDQFQQEGMSSDPVLEVVTEKPRETEVSTTSTAAAATITPTTGLETPQALRVRRRPTQVHRPHPTPSPLVPTPHL